MADETYDSAGFAPVSPEAAAQADPYASEGFSRVGEVSAEDAAVAVGKGAAYGALNTAGLIPGALAGAAIGAPLGPVGTGVGAVAGAAYGMWAGKTAAEGVVPGGNPENMAPELRPFGIGGESFGGSMGALGFPTGAAITGYRLAESQVGKLLNRIIDTAKKSPLLFGATELSTATSAATAAATSEALFPGEIGKRMGAELVGGAVNPSRLVIGAGNFATKTMTNAYQSMTPAGRTTAAAKMIAETAAKTGEDLDLVYRVYKATGVAGLDGLTPAQKTGSMALGALEDHLAEFSGKFDAESKAKAMHGLDVLRGHISLLTKTGDPAALESAAKIKDVYFRTLIQGRVDSAMGEAETAARKVTKDTPEARAALSVKVRDTLDKAIVDARKAENELWGKWVSAESDKASGYSNLQAQFKKEFDDVVKEYRPKRVPLEVEKFLNRVGKTGEPTFDYDPQTMMIRDIGGKPAGSTVGEMYKLRSELLVEARQLAITGDNKGALAMNNLAEAVLDDLDGAVSPGGKRLYDDARSYTREFHDTFSRSFVGKVVAEGKYGDRIAPELTLRRALASGGEAGALQLDDIQKATEFLTTRGLQDDGAVETVMDAQQRFLRLAASESINPETGKVNPDRLRKFVNSNEILMNRFPEVKKDLTDAIKTQRNADKLESLAKGQNRVMEDQKVFSKIVKSDGVTQAQKALLSNTMERDLGDLITTTLKGNTGKDGKPLYDIPTALNGLRSSIYAAAINASTGKNRGELNLDQVQALLFKPPSGGEKSAIQMLYEANVVTRPEVGKLRELFGALESIQRSNRVSTAVEVKTDMTDAAMAMFSRMLGSSVAGASARAAGSTAPSLIIHSAGAKFAENIFTKMNVTTARQMLIDAISDPSSGKLDIIMKKASSMTPKQVAEQAMQLNAWYVQSGAGIAEEITNQAYESYTGPGTKKDIK